MDWLSFIFITFILIVIYLFFSKNKQKRQLAFIKSYHFHPSIKNKIYDKYPHLTNEQIHMVFRALRDYFWMCNKAKRNMVAMPSQVVDDAWHEFILFTRNYETFCKKGIGRFLHHTPTQAMRTPTLAETGIKRAWRLACAKDSINPRTPARLPLIFSIDSLLLIPGGFSYSLNCLDTKNRSSSDGYCAGHIGCSSGCTGDSGGNHDAGGFFDGMFDSSGSDCGGGCGGD